MDSQSVRVVIHGLEELRSSAIDVFSEHHIAYMQSYLDSLGWSNKQIVELLDDVLLEVGDNKVLPKSRTISISEG